MKRVLVLLLGCLSLVTWACGPIYIQNEGLQEPSSDSSTAREPGTDQPAPDVQLGDTSPDGIARPDAQGEVGPPDVRGVEPGPPDATPPDSTKSQAHGVCQSDASCATGLRCWQGYCYKACDTYLNPRGCPAKHTCQKPGICTPLCPEPLLANGFDLTCPLGMVCKDAGEVGYCTPTDASAPSPSGNVLEGQPCSSGTKKFCDARKGLFCDTRGGNVCRKACDPRRADNTQCGGRQRCFVQTSLSPWQGICLTNKTYKAGEQCRQDVLQCEKGLVCSSNVCSPICDQAQGIASNPVCPREQQCAVSIDGERFACGPLPAASAGTLGLGETCALQATGANSCAKGLACFDLRCVAVCHPKDGTDANPACAVGEQCLEGTELNAYPFQIQKGVSRLGGLCVSKGTQKEYEACGLLAKRCVRGLVCDRGVCHKRCKTNDGTRANPSCAAGELCLFGQISQGVCVPGCDLTKGIGPNVACPGTMHCAPCLGRCIEKVYCKANTAVPTGSKKEGEACSVPGTPGNCDGTKLLFCKSRTCKRGCSLGKGVDNNPDCKTGEQCVVELESPWFGRCASASDQKLGETCDGVATRCGAGLYCLSEYDRVTRKTTQVCRNICDLAKGAAANPVCPADRACRLRPDFAGGVCWTLPRAVSGGLGEGTFCDESYGTAYSCDTKSDLFCTNRRCERGCIPKEGQANNKRCRGNELCLEHARSFLGGLCTPATTLPLGSACDQITRRCNQGLLCLSGQCHQACDVSKGVKQNPACVAQGTAWTCVSLYGVPGVCLKPCSQLDGTFANPSCPKGTYCSGLPGAEGYCNALMPQPSGSKTGGSCGSIKDGLCDRSKGYACTSWDHRCHKVCDPHKGHVDCGADEVCQGDQRSWTGGVCLRRGCHTRYNGADCPSGSCLGSQNSSGFCE